MMILLRFYAVRLLLLRFWWLTVALYLLAVPAVRAADAPAATAEWRIDTRQHADGIPTSNLDLIINGRQVVALESGDIMGDYRPLARKDFAGRKLPAEAICACESIVVNSGVRYYVVAAGKDRLAVYRQFFDVDGPQRFKRVRTVKIEAR